VLICVFGPVAVCAKVNCAQVKTPSPSQELVEVQEEVAVRSLSGIVVDTAGYPIPGATVELLDLVNKTCLAAETTSTNGSFKFDRGRAGRYVLRTTKDGFNTLLVKVKTTHSHTKALKIMLPVSK